MMDVTAGNLSPASAHRDRAALASLRRSMRRHPWLYVMVIPAILYFAVFAYGPMFGVVIAFKEFNAFSGIWDSEWVGLMHFRNFFDSIYFWRLIRNTLLLNLYGLLVGFPAPVILALMLNEVVHARFKRTVQTLTYLPYFISTVVVTGIIINFLSPSTGIVNNVIKTFGAEPIHFLNLPEWFRHIYVWSDVWQFVGWSSIIYLAALAGIDPTLYESAEIDGAGRFARMRYISLPGILPTMMIILLLSLGSLMSVGFEKVYLLYNPSTFETADVISTYVYRAGLISGQYDFGTAVGLFNSLVALVLLVVFNWIAGRMKQQTLW